MDAGVGFFVAFQLHHQLPEVGKVMKIGADSYDVAIYQPQNGHNGKWIPATNARDEPFVKHVPEDKLMPGKVFSLTKTERLPGKVLKDLNVLWNQ